MVLIWPTSSARWRLTALGSLLALQIGLGSTIELGLFPVVATLALLPHVPETSWNRITRRSLASPRPPADVPRLAGRLARTTAGIALALVLVVNLETFTPPPWRVDQVADVLGLSQSWTMYDAPGRYEARPLVTPPGQETTRQAPGADAAVTASLPPGYRTKMYLEWLTEPDFDASVSLVDWICRHSPPPGQAPGTVAFRVETRRLRADDVAWSASSIRLSINDGSSGWIQGAFSAQS